MVESVIMLLIYICLVVALAYVVIWVLSQLGIGIPAQVLKIFWVIVVLIIILLLWRMIGSSLTNATLFSALPFGPLLHG